MVELFQLLFDMTFISPEHAIDISDGPDRVSFLIQQQQNLQLI